MSKLNFLQGADKCLDIYKVRTAAEIKKKLARRAKRLREKQTEETELEEVTEKASDEFHHVHMHRASAKIRSFDIRQNKTGHLVCICQASVFSHGVSCSCP